MGIVKCGGADKPVVMNETLPDDLCLSFEKRLRALLEARDGQIQPADVIIGTALDTTGPKSKVQTNSVVKVKQHGTRHAGRHVSRGSKQIISLLKLR